MTVFTVTNHPVKHLILPVTFSPPSKTCRSFMKAMASFKSLTCVVFSLMAHFSFLVEHTVLLFT